MRRSLIAYQVFAVSMFLCAPYIAHSATTQPVVESIVLAQNRIFSDSEPQLRTSLAAFSSGSPNYEDMEPILKIAVEQQWPMISRRFSALGALRQVEFIGPQNGLDVYKVTFKGGITSWAIQIAPNGKIGGLWFQ